MAQHDHRDMQLGAMLESGEISSSKWSADPILWWYQMTFMVIIFFSLFNFIIAIIGVPFAPPWRYACLADLEQLHLTGSPLASFSQMPSAHMFFAMSCKAVWVSKCLCLTVPVICTIGNIVSTPDHHRHHS